MLRLSGLVVAAGIFAGGAVSLAPPAAAVPFKNCSQARAAGYCDIPSDSEYYAPRLDRDGDGLACEC